MRSFLLLATLALALALAASGCNCGRQTITMTEASVTLPTDSLDFGIVAEGTSKGGKFRVENVGRAPVNIVVTMATGASADFALGTVPATIEAGGFIEVPVVFTPSGAGEDSAIAEVKSATGAEMPLSVSIHGGPIFPALAFEPDPLDFRPATMPLERKTVQLKSVGTSALTIRSVGVSATGNPQFSVVPPAVPSRLLPGESLGVRVDYARNGLTTEGVMEVLSDDQDAGLRTLRLLPDRAAQCADGVDNDMDGLIDFPADPGCQDAMDNDETNSAVCVNGGTQPCNCGGQRTCVNGAYGACVGGTGCDAGVDAGVDAGTPPTDAGCNPNGTFVLDAGVIAFTCCEIFPGYSLVNINISQFQIQSNATVLRPTPMQPSTTLTTTVGPTCPSGSFTYQVIDRGMGSTACVETYTLTGNFVGPDTFVGTYTADFTGAECTTSLCASDPCLSKTWNISAGR